MEKELSIEEEVQELFESEEDLLEWIFSCDENWTLEEALECNA